VGVGEGLTVAGTLSKPGFSSGKPGFIPDRFCIEEKARLLKAEAGLSACGPA
jgi:hypothetical protein